MTTKLFYTATVVATMFSAAVPAMAARCPPGLLAGVYCQMDNMVAESQIWQRMYAHAKELCENGDENACDVADDMAEQAQSNWQRAMHSADGKACHIQTDRCAADSSLVYPSWH